MEIKLLDSFLLDFSFSEKYGNTSKDIIDYFYNSLIKILKNKLLFIVNKNDVRVLVHGYSCGITKTNEKKLITLEILVQISESKARSTLVSSIELVKQKRKSILTFESLGAKIYLSEIIFLKNNTYDNNMGTKFSPKYKILIY